MGKLINRESISNSLKIFVKNCLPPFIVMIFRRTERLFSTIFMKNKKEEWEFVSMSWPKKENSRGWLENSIASTQRKKWDEFNQALNKPDPLGIAHEAIELNHEDFCTHNLVMTFGYILGLVAQSKKSLSILDWGGGLGHYYLFSKTLYPDIHIDYTCKDTMLLCNEARALLPEVQFQSIPEKVFEQQYDLVFASCSIHYEENWQVLIENLISSSKKYIYLTRVPIVEGSASFVILQRPHLYGYNTEYISWVFNRDEFLEQIYRHKVKLLREFLVDKHPLVHNAPKQGKFSGFLFEKL